MKMEKIENNASPDQQVILDTKKLGIIDPDQLKRGLANCRTNASGAVHELESVLQGGKVKRNSDLFKPLIDAAEGAINRAKELGLNVADLEEKFKKFIEE